MSYSLDFHKRVMDFKVKRGLTFEQTSQHFNLPIRTLFRWQQQLEPKRTKNRPAIKIDMDELAKDVEL